MTVVWTGPFEQARAGGFRFRDCNVPRQVQRRQVENLSYVVATDLLVCPSLEMAIEISRPVLFCPTPKPPDSTIAMCRGGSSDDRLKTCPTSWRQTYWSVRQKTSPQYFDQSPPLPQPPRHFPTGRAVFSPYFHEQANKPVPRPASWDRPIGLSVKRWAASSGGTH